MDGGGECKFEDFYFYLCDVAFSYAFVQSLKTLFVCAGVQNKSGDRIIMHPM